MDDRLRKLEQEAASHTEKFGTLSSEIKGIDQKLDGNMRVLNSRFDVMDQRLSNIDNTLARMDSKLNKVDEIAMDVAVLKNTFSDLPGWKTSTGDALKRLEVNTATITERIAHLPRKGFIVSSSLLALGVFAAVVLFQGNILKFFGSTPPLP